MIAVLAVALALAQSPPPGGQAPPAAGEKPPAQEPPFQVVPGAANPHRPGLVLQVKEAPGLKVFYYPRVYMRGLMSVLEDGRRPLARFDRVLARLETTVEFGFEGRRLAAGNYALILIPNHDGHGLQLEVRREPPGEFLAPNKLAAPPGETVAKVPLGKSPEPGPFIGRLAIDTASRSHGGVALTFRYGDWQSVKELTP